MPKRCQVSRPEVSMKTMKQNSKFVSSDENKIPNSRFLYKIALYGNFSIIVYQRFFVVRGGGVISDYIFHRA